MQLALLLATLSASAADGAALAAAGNLPAKAQELRDKGLDADQVAAALAAAKDAKLSAGDAATLLADTAPLVENHGPISNFGDFVKGKLGEGLRGPELAAAIKAEHEKGGKGKPDGAKPDPAKPDPAKPDPAKPDPAPSAGPKPAPGRITRPGTPTPTPGSGGRLTRPGGDTKAKTGGGR